MKDEIIYLKASLYYSDVSFSTYHPFFSYAEEILKNRENSISSLSQLLKLDYNQLTNNKKLIDEKLLTRDNSDCEKLFLKIANLIKGVFPKMEIPKLFFVNELPSIYKNFGSAFYVDKYSLKFHNVEPGIYILNQNLNHPFFELIITHELIHHLIEEYSVKKVRYANMIEEGICDYLSYYFLLKFNL